MTQWRDSETAEETEAATRRRAVAYYRGSAGNGHDIPIAIQRRLTREWAKRNGVEIIREFVDAGTPGNTSAHRPGFAAVRQQCVTRISLHQVAQRLGMGWHTVHAQVRHIRRCFKRLGIDNLATV